MKFAVVQTPLRKGSGRCPARPAERTQIRARSLRPGIGHRATADQQGQGLPGECLQFDQVGQAALLLHEQHRRDLADGARKLPAVIGVFDFLA